MDFNIFDRVSTRVAEIIVKASDDMAEIYRGDPKLIRKIERKTFNEMTEAAMELLRAQMGGEWVMEWLTRMQQGQRR